MVISFCPSILAFIRRQNDRPGRGPPLPPLFGKYVDLTNFDVEDEKDLRGTAARTPLNVLRVLFRHWAMSDRRGREVV